MIDLPNQTKELLKLMDSLKKEYAELFEQRNYMLQYEEPLLTSLYLTLLGQFQFRLFTLKGDLAQLNQRIQMAQAYFNRNELPDWHKIDVKIDQLFSDYYKQIENDAQQLAAAKEFLKSDFITDEEAKKLKAIYKLLVKKLHPDINPTQTPKEVELFLKVQAAYDLGDLRALNEILLYLSNEDAKVPDFVPDIKAKVEKIKTVIDDLNEKIEKLNSSFPFVYREKIKDEAWVEDEKLQIDVQVNVIEKELKAKSEYLKLMKTWKPE